MITIFCDFSQVFRKYQCYDQFFQNLALFWFKNAHFFAKFFGKNNLENHNIGPRGRVCFQKSSRLTFACMKLQPSTECVCSIRQRIKAKLAFQEVIN
jgi:hypothetical protein